jgi:hypothetical protein
MTRYGRRLSRREIDQPPAQVPWIAGMGPLSIICTIAWRCTSFRLARRTSIVGSDEGQRHEVGYFRHGSILRLLSNRFPVNKARRRQC